MIDTYQLDEMISAGNPPAVGTEIDWHGQKGSLIKLTGGEPAVKVEVPCVRCSEQVEITVISGCHAGAFCYVVGDDHASIVADLRNQSVACEDCA